ncbi:MAG: hypothetical protein KKG47_11855 [Proteobacteria bacterium]|nr:hypothetical protein [Pseudomonadota bacterium]MBU1737815.1 hypothetical protein [Pseudomonadota bacterium]
MNTNDIWDKLGDLSENELVHVITKLFAVYEKRLELNDKDLISLDFFNNLTNVVNETCQCNSNRR